MLKNKHWTAIALFIASCSFHFFLPASVFAASTSITKIIFTTTPQNISPGAVSDIISIQAQNASGNPEQIDETNDLFLTSSLGGQFSSSLASWQSTSQITMSKNTANKNFYYKNTNSGQDTITAKIVGRTTGLTFSTSQPITVGNDSDNTNIATTSNSVGDDTATTTDTSATSTSDIAPTVITKIVYLSTHSSPEDLSNWQDVSNFVISAGRERTTYIGVPVEFLAKYNAISGSVGIPVFHWSFGDGTELSDKIATHTYKSPGDYTVVLNGTLNGITAVSRATVHVLPPQITILAILNGDVQVVNNGNTEINLGAWKLSEASHDFIFPIDTIVLPKTTITLSSADTKIIADKNDKLYLYDPSGGEVASIDFIGDNFASASSSEVLSNVIEKNLGMTVQKAEIIVSLLKKQNMQVAINNQSTSTDALATRSITNTEQTSQVSRDENILQTGAVESVYVTPATTTIQGFWSRVSRFFRF